MALINSIHEIKCQRFVGLPNKVCVTHAQAVVQARSEIR